MRIFILILACTVGCIDAPAQERTKSIGVSTNAILEALAEIDQLGGTYAVRQPKGAAKEAIEALGYDIRFYWDATRVSLGPDNAPYDPTKPITDDRLSSLHDAFLTLRNIELLDLSRTPVTNRGVASLPPMLKLRHLRLDGTNITDGLHELLVRFPALETISVIDTGFSAEEWVAMQNRFPRLKIVRVQRRE